MGNLQWRAGTQGDAVEGSLWTHVGTADVHRGRRPGKNHTEASATQRGSGKAVRVVYIHKPHPQHFFRTPPILQPLTWAYPIPLDVSVCILLSLSDTDLVQI